jgi:apolipoprotein D and lipocalin family protein
MLRRILFALSVAVVCGLFACGGANPPLDVAQNVDLSRFQGKWYEIAKLPRTTQTDCYATMAFYTQESDGALSLVNQCNVGSTDGPLNTISMTATVTDPTVPAKLALQVGGFSGDYWIIEVGTNYEYAVVGHPTRAYLWILSRTPVLDSTTLQGIVSRAQANQFDVSTLEYTPQVTTGARVSSGEPLGTVPPAVTTGCAMSRAPGGGKDSWCSGLAISGLIALRASRRRRSGRPPADQRVTLE